MPGIREGTMLGNPARIRYQTGQSYWNVIQNKSHPDISLAPAPADRWLMIPTATPFNQHKEVTACPHNNRPMHPKSRQP